MKEVELVVEFDYQEQEGYVGPTSEHFVPESLQVTGISIEDEAKLKTELEKEILKEGRV